MSGSVQADPVDCEVVNDLGTRPRRIRLQLPPGATLANAVGAACAAWGEAPPDLGRMHIGVWGQEARPTQALRDGDRVELYRELPHDPRAARRARAGGRAGRR